MYKVCNICNRKKLCELFVKGRNKCLECNNLERRSKYKESICRQCQISFRPGVEGRYKFCSEICRFRDKIIENKETGCWMWQANKDNLGYGKFTPLGGRNGLAHRASYRLFRGPIEEGKLVLHSCHTPSCVSPMHLRLGSNADNMKDKMNARRHKVPTGKEHHKAKLTEQDILDIRNSKLKQKELATKYDVSIDNISQIIRRIIWKHI